MKIALGQLDIKFEDKQNSFAAAQGLVKTAAESGCDMIFFPEMSLTGFSMNTAATKEDGRQTVTRFAQCAKNHGIAVGFGWVRDAGERSANMYTVLDKNGGLIAEYTKIHPFSYAGEDKYFISGDSLCRFEYMGVKFGLVICYDLRFSYIFGGDYDVMLVPANWPKSREGHWLTLLRARAIENQAYCAGINCAGADYGSTAAFDPNGDEICRLFDTQGIAAAEVSAETAARIREAFPVRKDRKNFGSFDGKR